MQLEKLDIFNKRKYNFHIEKRVFAKRERLMTEIEDDIQQYMIGTAQRWKKESKRLLYKYRDNKKAFETVLNSVIGKGGGGVLRNIKKDMFPQFSEYVRKNISKIEKGEFDIFSVETFPDKQPVSFISKVCHIINPKAYPVIYDSYVKKALGIKYNKNLQENWYKRTNEIKQTQKGNESLEDLYRVDSEYWLQGAPRIS